MANTSFAAMNAGRTLKVVGIILILSFLIDFIILLLPFQPTDRTWQISLATALVDRGIVPIVGLGMLFSGYWADSFANDNSGNSGIDLRMPALILSSILGLMFLLIFPLHLNNVRQASTQRVEQINKQAEQAQTQLSRQASQLEAQLNSEQGKAVLENRRKQLKAQITELLKDEKKYNEALANPALNSNLKELLNKAKANPKDIDKLVAQQIDPQALAKQQLSQINERKEEAAKRERDGAWRSGVRIGISSLLLAIGYIIIGWTGLRNMGTLRGNSRKATTA
ncbi:MAG: HpsJ family protein [Mastigocoleus sp. MO_167.B18]|nr:HpsJ family protein [Mastigocoleus sp. MO_167.B18]